MSPQFRYGAMRDFMVGKGKRKTVIEKVVRQNRDSKSHIKYFPGSFDCISVTNQIIFRYFLATRFWVGFVVLERFSKYLQGNTFHLSNCGFSDHQTEADENENISPQMVQCISAMLQGIGEHLGKQNP